MIALLSLLGLLVIVASVFCWGLIAFAWACVMVEQACKSLGRLLHLSQ